MSSPSKVSRRASRHSTETRSTAVSRLSEKSTPNCGQLNSSSDAESSHAHSEYGPSLLDLDEPMHCEFRIGEKVWVKLRNSSESEWVRGEISGTGRPTVATRYGEGMQYPVRYKEKKREYFTPQNGELKPDNQDVHALLVAGGWLPEP